MRSYQSVLIVKSDLDEAQVDRVLEKITEFLSKNNGSILKAEKWGRSAWPIGSIRAVLAITSMFIIRVKV